YLKPLPLGNLPRPVKLDAIVQEEAEVEGERTTDLVAASREADHEVFLLSKEG
ncbi:hypothetical protein A2U01_0080631, partial [Trifolium medium]|nr:hypothetical protein [Trifolium medium]